MEATYGIGVKNRYAVFLGDEEDPLEILAKSEEVAKLAAANKPKPDAGKATPGAKDANASKTKQSQAAAGQAAGQGKLGSTPAPRTAYNNKDPARKPQVRDGKEVASSPPKPKGEFNRSRQEGGGFTRGPRPDRVVKPSNRGPGDSTTNFNSETGGKDDKPASGFQSGAQFRDQREIEERKNRRNREDKPPGTRFGTEFRERGERSDGDFGGRSATGGRGAGSRGAGPRGRGGRGGRGGGFDNRGKREYDRQSGSDKSGVKPTEKREGGGAHNWGTVEDDICGQGALEATPMDETLDVGERSGDDVGLDATGAKEGGDEQKGEEEAKDEDVEPEIPEKTLEEFRKEEEAQRLVPKFNLRKPGEGEDNAQWKKTFVLKKKEEEEEVEYEEVEEEIVRRGRQKQLLDIDINFRDENREVRRGGGRGRGGPRGGRDDRGGGGGYNRGRGGGERRDRGPENRGPREDGGRWERGPDNRGPREDGGRRERGPDGEGRGRGAEDGRGRGPRPEGVRGAVGGRGGFRGPRDGREQAAPKVDDWNDFPSLAAA